VSQLSPVNAITMITHGQLATSGHGLAVALTTRARPHVMRRDVGRLMRRSAPSDAAHQEQTMRRDGQW